MLYSLVVECYEFGEIIIQWIKYAATLIEIVAVAIIVLSIFYSLLRHTYQRNIGGREPKSAYRALKGRLGRTMLLGLELLVAADIVRTVALEAAVGVASHGPVSAAGDLAAGVTSEDRRAVGEATGA